MPQVAGAPKELNDLLERVYQGCIRGGGDKGTCSRKAWAAVKGAGWSKDREGNWVRSKEAAERVSILEQFSGKSPSDLCPGEGFSDSVMLVDSNPTKEDVKSQSPFTGPPGEVLEGMLGLARLKREEVYLTYLVKEYVDDVEKVGRETLSKWFNMLKEEVKVVKPKVVVAMGDFVTKLLFGEGDVNTHRLKAVRQGNYFLTCSRSPKMLVEEIEEQAKAYDEMLFLRRLVFVSVPMRLEEVFGKSLEEGSIWSEESDSRIWLKEGGGLQMSEEFRIDFCKIDKKKRLVTGPVLIPKIADSQGDVIDEEEVERAAHNFLKNLLGGQGEDNPIDVMHMDPTHKTELVETYLSPVDFSIGKNKVRKGTWLITVHIIDDKAWEKVESGFLKGFSIQGSMEAVPYKPKPEEIGG